MVFSHNVLNMIQVKNSLEVADLIWFLLKWRLVACISFFESWETNRRKT